jgi:hypothetical protein
VKSAKQESPELKFQIVQGPELTEEEMNGIAMVLAKMIHRQLISDSREDSLTLEEPMKSKKR